MTKKVSKLFLLVIPAALIAIIALTGCHANNDGSTASTAAPSESGAEDIGEGSTVFAFEITDNDKTVNSFRVHTDEETVGAALLAVGLIEGEQAAYGFYVKSVNGTKADYDVDKAYWAFYVDGEYASSGVDSTNIESNKVYSFVYAKE